MKDNIEYHVPIMKDECLEFLQIEDGKLYLDGTLGGGGHSEAILQKANCKLIAFDRDSEALEFAGNRLNQAGLDGRYTLIHDNFKNSKEALRKIGVESVDGAILDLGISSHQIDEPERGFSYRFDAKLDMRMDMSQSFSAYDIVNTYEEEKLAKILFLYGEEKFSRNIARKIVKKRAEKKIETTSELVDIIKSSVPFSQKGGHPAKRTFQALRIEVNEELTGLDKALEDIVELLSVGARFAVITFHSLEDRIVKQTFKLLATDCICDKSYPICICNHKKTVKLISKGTKSSEIELEDNSRAKSATLRVIEKL